MAKKINTKLDKPIQTSLQLIDFMATLDVLVVGDNGCWGRADTLDEALRNAYRPKRYIAYVATPETRVSEIDGSVFGFWKVIARKGVKK